MKAERANYFDAGISQKLAPGLQVGVDGYYKQAKNQLDDGLFGQTLILSAFNYAEGRVYGVEFTGSYTTGGFSTYANVAYSVAQGEDWSSAQFLFDPTDLAYVKNHWIYLDHDQRVTGSFGTSYLFNESQRTSTRVYVDALYGSGLRTGFDGQSVAQTFPMAGAFRLTYSVNIGAAQSFKIHQKQILTARLDVVNVTDNIYELRNGTGVGVNAAQYGERSVSLAPSATRSEHAAHLMNNTDANRIMPGYELKDELARYCLPAANQDSNLKLAWVNSICILFLFIGILGARRGVIAIKPVPPIREEVPVVVQPTVLPPQAIAQKPEQAEQNNQPRVLVALPNAPNVNFGVPTVGTLVVPAALASPPAGGPRTHWFALQHRHGRRTA